MPKHLKAPYIICNVTNFIALRQSHLGDPSGKSNLDH